MGLTAIYNKYGIQGSHQRVFDKFIGVYEHGFKFSDQIAEAFRDIGHFFHLCKGSYNTQVKALVGRITELSGKVQEKDANALNWGRTLLAKALSVFNRELAGSSRGPSSTATALPPPRSGIFTINPQKGEYSMFTGANTSSTTALPPPVVPASVPPTTSGVVLPMQAPRS